MEPSNTSGASAPFLRILSLDGGGIRGKSSLLILEEIMERIAKAEKLDHIPKPCDYFDFIGGTSTGGIIATMLGRLSMTVNECIQAFDKVSKLAFTPKRHFTIAPPKGAYSAQNLEDAIKQTVREFCTEESCVALRSNGTPTTGECMHDNLKFRNESCTKTAVLAITKDNVDAPPTLFTTYDTSARLNGCTIWQVARATSAATTFFKSIQLGRDNIDYIDAGFGYNNPCEVIIEEAKQQFPTHSQLRVLSIGTGLGNVVTIKDKRWYIIKALEKMATNSSKVAARLDKKYGDGGQYYRFNVARGLQDISLSDWDEASRISAHTTNYITENQRAIERFVDSFLQSSITSLEIPVLPSETRSIPTHFCVPFHKNMRFVGRNTILAQLEKMHFENDCRQVALVGLGGIGKTQVAIQFAYWVKENRLDYSVFWVPALSTSAFEQAYTDIARELAIHKTSDNEDLKETVRRYLDSGKAGKWLLIVDNADDMDVLYGSSGASAGIKQYLPRGDNVLTLFTTRSRKVAQSCAESNIIELSQMEPLEALNFFKRSLDQSAVKYEETTAMDLVHEIVYLPLAIKQAVAYINTMKLPIREYLQLLQGGTEQDMVELMSEEFHDDFRYPDSQNAVATTWLISFDQINKNKNAARLLAFISRIEPKAIPQSILPRFQSARQQMDAIGTLCSFAFLVRRDGCDIFDIHRLVHLGARVWIQRQNLMSQIIHESINQLKEIFPNGDYTYQNLWQAYLPHALRVLHESSEDDSKERCWLFIFVGVSLHHEWRMKESTLVLEEAYQWTIKHLPEDDKLRLRSEHELAVLYMDDGRIKEAIIHIEHVVAIRKRIYRAEDAALLASEHELARAYLKDGRTKEAIESLQHIVAVEKTLPKEHRGRLTSENVLADAYLQDGQVENAIELLEYVVAVRNSLPKTHPDRLVSENELARAYLRNGQVADAIKLFEHVVEIQQMLPKEHPDRLASEHELAWAYLHDGRVEKAIELFSYVVGIEREILKADDPSRIMTEESLEYAYEKLREREA